jgi:hypothetical protein
MWGLREEWSEHRAAAADGVVRSGGDRAAAMPRALHAQAAAPAVAVTPAGTVLIAYVSGDAEGAEGAAIVVARLAAGTATFESPPRVVARVPGRALGPPVIFHSPVGGTAGYGGSGLDGGAATTVLFSTSDAFGGVKGNRLAGVRSVDDGVRWTDIAATDLPGDLHSVEVHAPPIQVACHHGGAVQVDSIKT